MEYCKKYCNSIAILFQPSIAIAIAILFASIANNPGRLTANSSGASPDYFNIGQIGIHVSTHCVHPYFCGCPCPDNILYSPKPYLDFRDPTSKGGEGRGRERRKRREGKGKGPYF